MRGTERQISLKRPNRRDMVDLWRIPARSQRGSAAGLFRAPNRKLRTPASIENAGPFQTQPHNPTDFCGFAQPMYINGSTDRNHLRPTVPPAPERSGFFMRCHARFFAPISIILMAGCRVCGFGATWGRQTSVPRRFSPNGIHSSSSATGPRHARFFAPISIVRVAGSRFATNRSVSIAYRSAPRLSTRPRQNAAGLFVYPAGE